MVEVNLSPRAQKIYAGLNGVTLIRQQTLADALGCSRRSIGRALKELKEAGLLVDLNKRHENRCKLYTVIPASSRDPGAWIAGSLDSGFRRKDDCFCRDDDSFRRFDEHFASGNLCPRGVCLRFIS